MIRTAIHPDVERVLFPEEELQRRICALGKQISEDYAGKNPLLVCILKGSVHFFADLAKAVTIDCEYDFVAASSYGDGTQSSGSLKVTKDVSTDLKDRHVILIDDIIDSGLTLQRLKELFLSRQTASVRTCALLDKPSRRTERIKADYAGFTIDNLFVVGYGLDYCQKYRNLPYIGILKPDVYAAPAKEA